MNKPIKTVKLSNEHEIDVYNDGSIDIDWRRIDLFMGDENDAYDYINMDKETSKKLYLVLKEIFEE